MTSSSLRNVSRLYSKTSITAASSSDGLNHLIRLIGGQGELKDYNGFEALKRFLSISRILIFDSKVDRAIPNLAAAPEGP
jgi:hypothetical protein